MPSPSQPEFQAGRHGGARPGAGAPRGPRPCTIAWEGLIAGLVRQEVGKAAFALMPRANVLRLAARIFMFDGDPELAARAYSQANRLARPHSRKPARSAKTPPRISSPPPAVEPLPDPGRREPIDPVFGARPNHEFQDQRRSGLPMNSLIPQCASRDLVSSQISPPIARQREQNA